MYNRRLFFVLTLFATVYSAQVRSDDDDDDEPSQPSTVSDAVYPFTGATWAPFMNFVPITGRSAFPSFGSSYYERSRRPPMHPNSYHNYARSPSAHYNYGSYPSRAQYPNQMAPPAYSPYGAYGPHAYGAHMHPHRYRAQAPKEKDTFDEELAKLGINLADFGIGEKKEKKTWKHKKPQFAPIVTSTLSPVPMHPHGLPYQTPKQQEINNDPDLTKLGIDLTKFGIGTPRSPYDNMFQPMANYGMGSYSPMNGVREHSNDLKPISDQLQELNSLLAQMQFKSNSNPFQNSMFPQASSQSQENSFQQQQHKQLRSHISALFAEPQSSFAPIFTSQERPNHLQNFKAFTGRANNAQKQLKPELQYLKNSEFNSAENDDFFPDNKETYTSTKNPLSEKYFENVRKEKTTYKGFRPIVNYKPHNVNEPKPRHRPEQASSNDESDEEYESAEEKPMDKETRSQPKNLPKKQSQEVEKIRTNIVLKPSKSKVHSSEDDYAEDKYRNGAREEEENSSRSHDYDDALEDLYADRLQSNRTISTVTEEENTSSEQSDQLQNRNDLSQSSSKAGFSQSGRHGNPSKRNADLKKPLRPNTREIAEHVVEYLNLHDEAFHSPRSLSNSGLEDDDEEDQNHQKFLNKVKKNKDFEDTFAVFNSKPNKARVDVRGLNIRPSTIEAKTRHLKTKKATSRLEQVGKGIKHMERVYEDDKTDEYGSLSKHPMYKKYQEI